MCGARCKISVLILLVLALLSSSFAGEASLCRIHKVVWVGDHSAYDEAHLNLVEGAPCEA